MRNAPGVVLTVVLLQFGCAHDPAVVARDQPVDRQVVHDAPRSVNPPAVIATTAPSREPYTVLDELPMISRVHPLGDGRIELRVPWKKAREGWELATEDASGDVLTVWPLEPVFIRNIDMLGAGAHWIQYVGDRDGYLIFRDRTWFYDIFPESNSLFGVRPYGRVTD